MNEHITEDLVIEDRQIVDKKHYTRYKTDYFIEPEMFSTAIRNLGGCTDERMVE